MRIWGKKTCTGQIDIIRNEVEELVELPALSGRYIKKEAIFISPLFIIWELGKISILLWEDDRRVGQRLWRSWYKVLLRTEGLWDKNNRYFRFLRSDSYCKVPGSFHFVMMLLPMMCARMYIYICRHVLRFPNPLLFLQRRPMVFPR